VRLLHEALNGSRAGSLSAKPHSHTEPVIGPDPWLEAVMAFGNCLEFMKSGHGRAIML
jgi:hypothetical protein